MSSEDAGIVVLRLPGGQGQAFPFDAQVEIPASAGRVAVLNERVDVAVARWVQHNDWRVGPTVYSTEVDEDGVRRRVGRFKVLGLAVAE